MRGVARRILVEVGKQGEIPLATAIRMAGKRHGNHIDQYPLALLIEQGYVGLSINAPPPQNGEEMCELFMAINLHAWSLPTNKSGDVEYNGIIYHGQFDTKVERIFLKAKGALYLDEIFQKRKDRIITFVLGLVTGVIGASVSAWLRASGTHTP